MLPDAAFASVEKLGFRFSDVKILLISHAHWDHCAGSALVKELTGGKQAGLSDTLTACPACPGHLREVRLGRVMVDVCVSCGGMFLDRGELDAAMAAVRGSTVEQVLAASAAASRA